MKASQATKCPYCGAPGSNDIGRDGSPRKMEVLSFAKSEDPIHVARRARAAALRRKNLGLRLNGGGC